jgi:hypothetical protein
MTSKLKQGFQELIEQANVLETSKYLDPRYVNVYTVDANELLKWKVRAKNLLANACGLDSQHFLQFEQAEHFMFVSNFDQLKRVRAVFEAAQEDFGNGYVASVHDLVRAEVFDSELEQAAELLKSGYDLPAAVIAGVVLETAIRELCAKNQIPHGKLDKMNADLAKAGIYNTVVQKRITHLAAIRNSAAHGNVNEFKTYDVQAMISEIEFLLANQLA